MTSDEDTPGTASSGHRGTGSGPAGWKLPGYVLEERLGLGGAAEVWRARVRATGDPVAVKRIRVTGGAQMRAARSEAAMLGVLEHPHLMRLHDLVVVPDAVVLVLDLAAGGSLHDLVRGRGPLSVGESLSAVAPIAAALAYLHRAGLVHGDVTPSNVLFTEIGLPLLGDLGVARLAGDETVAQSTPAFLDPAVARGGIPAAASDVFMVGAVALFALTGEVLWPGGDLETVLGQADRCGQDELDRRIARVAPEVGAVLSRALRIAPERRCSAAEFALDLRSAGRPVAVDLDVGRSRGGSGRAPGPGPDRPVAPPGRPGAAAVPPAPARRQARRRSPRHAVPRSVRRTSVPLLASMIEARRTDPAAGRRGRRSSTPRSVARAASPPDRPDFPRPRAPGADPLESSVGRPALTQGVRARPVSLPPTRRWTRITGRLGARRNPGRWLVASGVGVIALALGLASTTRVWSRDHGQAAGADPALSRVGGAGPAGPADAAGSANREPDGSASAPSARSVTSTDSSPPRSGSAAIPPAPTVAQLTSVLDTLDARRSAAFARRDAAALDQVYVAGPLRAEDSSTLVRLVPAGCGLSGLHTSYAGLVIRARAERSVQLQVRASLSPATLQCGGFSAGRSAGTGGVTLSITLVRAGDGYLIASEQRIS